MSIRKKGTAIISEEDLHKAMEKSLRRRESKSEPAKAPNIDVDAKYKMIFHEIDLDKDGFIGKEEFRVCLALMGQPVSEETLSIMIRLGDTNGDGMLDLSEFISLVKDPKSRVQKVILERQQEKEQGEHKIIQYRKQASKKASEPHAAVKLAEVSQADLASMDPAARRLRTVEIVHALLGTRTIRPRDIKVLHRKFQEADSKKTGKLTVFQFEKIFDAYSSIENRRLKSNYISLLFAFCDSDNSGQIDAKEFIIGLCWLSDFSNIEKLRFAFVLFDANGNGRMDREELVQLVAAVNMGRDSERSAIVTQVDKVFRDMAPTDAWRDYELSFEQLVAVADKYPEMFESM
jgi:Ca2+-binding EF-hand superfamily protein